MIYDASSGSHPTQHGSLSSTSTSSNANDSRTGSKRVHSSTSDSDSDAETVMRGLLLPSTSNSTAAPLIPARKKKKKIPKPGPLIPVPEGFVESERKRMEEEDEEHFRQQEEELALLVPTPRVYQPPDSKRATALDDVVEPPLDEEEDASLPLSSTSTSTSAPVQLPPPKPAPRPTNPTLFLPSAATKARQRHLQPPPPPSTSVPRPRPLLPPQNANTKPTSTHLPSPAPSSSSSSLLSPPPLPLRSLTPVASTSTLHVPKIKSPTPSIQIDLSTSTSNSDSIPKPPTRFVARKTANSSNAPHPLPHPPRRKSSSSTPSLKLAKEVQKSLVISSGEDDDEVMVLSDDSEEEDDEVQIVRSKKEKEKGKKKVLEVDLEESDDDELIVYPSTKSSTSMSITLRRSTSQSRTKSSSQSFSKSKKEEEDSEFVAMDEDGDIMVTKEEAENIKLQLEITSVLDKNLVEQKKYEEKTAELEKRRLEELEQERRKVVKREEERVWDGWKELEREHENRKEGDKGLELEKHKTDYINFTFQVEKFFLTFTPRPTLIHELTFRLNFLPPQPCPVTSETIFFSTTHYIQPVLSSDSSPGFSILTNPNKPVTLRIPISRISDKDTRALFSVEFGCFDLQNTSYTFSTSIPLILNGFLLPKLPPTKLTFFQSRFPLEKSKERPEEKDEGMEVYVWWKKEVDYEKYPERLMEDLELNDRTVNEGKLIKIPKQKRKKELRMPELKSVEGAKGVATLGKHFMTKAPYVPGDILPDEDYEMAKARIWEAHYKIDLIDYLPYKRRIVMKAAKSWALCHSYPPSILSREMDCWRFYSYLILQEDLEEEVICWLTELCKKNLLELEELVEVVEAFREKIEKLKAGGEEEEGEGKKKRENEKVKKKKDKKGKRKARDD